MSEQGPVLRIGSSLAWGQIELYNDRVEFNLRTRHMSVPIDQISGVGTSGVAARKLQVYNRGETIEADLTSMSDYMMLQEGIRRIKAGETLEPDQLRREEHEKLVRVGEEFWQDKNVRSCAIIMGIAVAAMFVVGIVIGVVQWLIGAAQWVIHLFI